MDFFIDPFEFPSNQSEIRASFESYVKSFEDSFRVSGPLEELDRDLDDIKRDLFLSVAGEEFIEDLEEVLSYPECASYEVILCSFLSKHNSESFLLQDTLTFRSLHQKEFESLPDYISRVRTKASLLQIQCSADLEKTIWIQILLGVQDQKLAQEAVEQEWTLDDLLSHSAAAESLDREVVRSLKETDTLVSKAENGLYYDQRALEKRHHETIQDTKVVVDSCNIISLGDAFTEVGIMSNKKMCMAEAIKVRGLTIAPQDNGEEEDESVKERRRNELLEIYKELKGGEGDEQHLNSSRESKVGGGSQCTGCHEVFGDRKKLCRHREKTCKWCSLCFQSKSDLSLHNVEAHNNTSAQCHLCHKILTSKSSLDLHMQTMHERNENFRCAYCGNGFPLEKMLSAHIKRAHLKERKFNCDRCGKRFETNSLLTKHINGVHEKKIVAICHICSKAFTQDSCYRAHVLRVHENIRNYKCDVCDARFHASADLQKHKKGVHDKILDFVCEYCKKGFSRNSILQKHIKAIHSNEREFQCNICSNGYVSKYNLYRHIQEAHERVKQKCDICQKDIAGFGTGNLAKHKKTAHGVSSATVIQTQ